VLHSDLAANQEKNVFWMLCPRNVAECCQFVVSASVRGLLPADPFLVPGALSPPKDTLQSLLQPCLQTLVQMLVEGNWAKAAR